MNKIQYYTIRILSGFIGILPFFVLHGISNFTAFVLHKVIKYRVKVVRHNIKKCFPDIDEKERKRIETKFYKNLSDITIESVKGLYISRKQIGKRFVIKNPEVLEKYYASGKNVLSLAGHYCNWEWGILGVNFQIKHQAVSMYKAMHNSFMEDFTLKKRQRFDMQLIPIHEAKSFFKKQQKDPISLILAADQNPSDKKNAIVVDFFGIETDCLHGPEAYGRNMGWPIVYFDIQRVKRSHYEMQIIELFDKPHETQFGEITQKYMSTLESIIRKNPENWLWSHKRWKSTPEQITEIKQRNRDRKAKENLT